TNVSPWGVRLQERCFFEANIDAVAGNSDIGNVCCLPQFPTLFHLRTPVARSRVRMSHRFIRPARFIAAAAVPFVFAAAVPVTDGMSYEFVMKSTSKATGNKEQVTLRGRGTYAGDDAKLEILDASSSTGGQEAFGAKGSYFIV